MSSDPAEYLTRWSLIDELHGDGAEATWRWFIARYRPYLATVLRRQGARPEEVEGLLDEFWGYLFDSGAVQRADRAGRFRSFLSGVARNFAAAWRRDQGRLAARLEPDLEVVAPAGEDDADLALWAEQLLHLALCRLGRAQPREERALRCFYGIADELGGAPCERHKASAIAAELGCSANAVHQLLHRARTHLRECLAREVAVTVGTEVDLDDELGRVVSAITRTAPGLTVVPAVGDGR